MTSAAWCIHFTGRAKLTCARGILYTAVRDPQGKLPCLFVEEATSQCTQRTLPSPEEAAAMEAAVRQLVTQWLQSGLIVLEVERQNDH
jgi:hypothetical protein